jgi:hypothetical protein
MYLTTACPTACYQLHAKEKCRIFRRRRIKFLQIDLRKAGIDHLCINSQQYVIVMGMGYLCPLDYEYKNLQF